MIRGNGSSGDSAFKVSKPSKPGIWMSRNTKSGFSRSISVTASNPSLASPIISTRSSSFSSRRRRIRALGSSSMSNERSLFMRRWYRNQNLGARSNTRLAFKRELGATTVNSLQSLFHIPEPQPGGATLGQLPRRARADTVIFDRQFEVIGVFASANGELVLAHLCPKTVLDRVFY